MPEPTYDERGLVPCIVQDAVRGTVLMLAWMNAEALRLTRETGTVHFWSRSRQAPLWVWALRLVWARRSPAAQSSPEQPWRLA